MATVRAYGETEKFLRTNESLIDLEDRAYFLTVVNQRWVSSCVTEIRVHVTDPLG